MAIADILNNGGGVGFQGSSLSNTFNNGFEPIRPKPTYAIQPGSGFETQPNANGGISSLGGPGYQAYMKPTGGSKGLDDLSKDWDFQNGLGYSKSSALNYKPTQAEFLGGAKGASGAPTGRWDAFKDYVQDSRAQAGVGDNSFSKMGTEGQMGVVNAGMNMVGLLGNFFK